MKELTVSQTKVAETLKADALKIKITADEFIVKDYEDAGMANQGIKKCTSIVKAIEEAKLSFTKDARLFVDSVNLHAKEIALPAQQAKEILKSKVLEFDAEMEKKKQEEARLKAECLSEIRGVKTLEELEKLSTTSGYITDNWFISACDYQKSSIEMEIKAAKDKEEREKEEARIAKLKKEQEDAAKLLEGEKNAIELEKIKIQQEAAASKLKEEQDRADLAESIRKVEADRVKLEQDRLAHQAELKEIEEAKLAAEADKANKVKGMKIRPKYEVINEDEVERSLCSPDSKKINEAIKNGLREAKGLKIWEEKSIN